MIKSFIRRVVEAFRILLNSFVWDKGDIIRRRRRRRSSEASRSAPTSLLWRRHVLTLCDVTNVRRLQASSSGIRDILHGGLFVFTL